MARLPRKVISALLLLMLTGCSGTTFVYNRLDFLIPWYVGKYVDLTRLQKQLLDEQLDPFCDREAGLTPDRPKRLAIRELGHSDDGAGVFILIVNLTAAEPCLNNARRQFSSAAKIANLQIITWRAPVHLKTAVRIEIGYLDSLHGPGQLRPQIGRKISRPLRQSGQITEQSKWIAAEIGFHFKRNVLLLDSGIHHQELVRIGIFS